MLIVLQRRKTSSHRDLRERERAKLQLHAAMEWVTTHHLDVGAVTQQPHHAAFHPTQALLAVAVGHHIHGVSIISHTNQLLHVQISLQF